MATSDMDRQTVRRRWLLLAWVGLFPLLLYLAIVVPPENPLPGVNGNYVGAGLAGLAFLFTWGVIRMLHTTRSAPRAEASLQKVALFSIVALFCFLMVDIVGSVYLNRTSPHPSGRTRDAHLWNGELLPQVFYPAESNFLLYKPQVSSAGYAYGEFYYPDLLGSPVLRESVLKLRRLDFVIDQYGLRNTIAPEDAEIFGLGDSFCFGYHMEHTAIWPELLQSRLKQPIYNMGVHGVSPFQELLLLEYLIEQHPQAFRPRRLLWLIFEGNDLEEPYTPYRPPEDNPAAQTFHGTIVQLAASLPGYLRWESMIRRLSSGEISLIGSAAKKQKSDHYESEGHRLAAPLYHSQRFGYKMFREMYLQRAKLSASDVRNHPNRPRLEATFQRMRELSEKGFQVTVVIVPTAPRLYKDYFDDFPPVSSEPHFINFLKELSDEVGFATVDLSVLLAPYASKELLYQRDDTHWNERGHAVVAELLANNVRFATATSQTDETPTVGRQADTHISLGP